MTRRTRAGRAPPRAPAAARACLTYGALPPASGKNPWNLFGRPTIPVSRSVTFQSPSPLALSGKNRKGGEPQRGTPPFTLGVSRWPSGRTGSSGAAQDRDLILHQHGNRQALRRCPRIVPSRL